MIISPCISICKTDPKTGFCYGCGRSDSEKRLWKLENTDDKWKKGSVPQKWDGKAGERIATHLMALLN